MANGSRADAETGRTACRSIGRSFDCTPRQGAQRGAPQTFS